VTREARRRLDPARAAEIVVCAAFVAGLVLSRRLYLSGRHYPLTPVVDWLPAVPPPFDHVLLWSLVTALALVAIVRVRAAVLAVVTLVVVLALGDQSRWQPWFYQYAVMLAVLALRFDRPRESADLWRLIIAATYVWSGVQKLNTAFVHQLFPWLVEPLVAGLPAWIQRAAATAGAIVPLVEIAIGAALLSRRSRTAGIALAVAMHAFVLAALGPLGHDTNTVVWPWNLAMASLVVILFRDPTAAGAAELLRPRRAPVHAAVLALFGLAPALHWLGWWDAYLSGTLYSGNLTAALVQVEEPVRTRLPAEVRRVVQQNRAGTSVIDVWEWSTLELNAPAYPEERVYRTVGRYLCDFADAPTDVRLIVFGRPHPVSGERERTGYDCAALTATGTSH
jgi:hypothetical protein